MLIVFARLNSSSPDVRYLLRAVTGMSLSVDSGVKALPESLRALMNLERFNLYKREYWQGTAADGSFDTKYLPQNCNPFLLPCYWVPRKHLYIYKCHDNCIKAFRWDFGRDHDDRILFPIHPASFPLYRDFLARVGAKDATASGTRIFALPTSSVRTLLAWSEQSPGDAVFVKTSMAFSPLFGDRRLLAKKVAYCVGVSRLVEDSKTLLPAGLGYFEEVAGFTPRTMLDGGVIFRSIPEAILEGRILPVPIFALMGGSQRHEPFLLTLAREGHDPIDFVETKLCAQFARIWILTSLGIGMLPEVHGQNLLLEFSPDLRQIGNFLYRDMDGLLIDWTLRDIRGLPKPTELPYSWSWFETYGALFPKDPHCSSTWWKLRLSLHVYLHYVLNEMNECLMTWQRTGLLGGRLVKVDDLTMSFSRHAIAAINDTYGMNVPADYNIYRNLNRFLLFLVKVRRECVLRV